MAENDGDGGIGNPRRDWRSAALEAQVSAGRPGSDSSDLSDLSDLSDDRHREDLDALNNAGLGRVGFGDTTTRALRKVLSTPSSALRAPPPEGGGKDNGFL